MIRFRRAVLVTALAAMLMAMAMPAVAAPGQTSSDVNAVIAAVRAATSQYHSEERAIADGYVRTDDCVAIPGGGMGYHYVNFALMGDPALDPERPEVLLYADSGKGRRLVAVEWIKLWSSDPNAVPPSETPVPTMFDTAFHGWMPGHFPGMPWHAELHAWIWQANPDGVFAQFNPNVSC